MENYLYVRGNSSTQIPQKILTLCKEKFARYNLDKKIRFISSGNHGTVIVFEDGKVQLTPPVNGSETLNNIVKSSTSYEHHLFLTSDGKVYSLGRNSYGQRGIGNQTASKAPELIKFFVEKNLQIRDIMCGVYQSYFITQDNDLYSCGYNSTKELGIKGDTEVKKIPTFVAHNVESVYSGNYAFHFFYQTTDGKVYFSGRTGEKSALSISTNESLPKEVTRFGNETILDISCDYEHSMILTQTEQLETKLYMMGPSASGEVDFFKGKPIKKIMAGDRNNLVLLENNDLYEIKTGSSKWLLNNSVFRINVAIPGGLEINLACGYETYWIYTTTGNALLQDLLECYQKSIITDSKISKFSTHKIFLEIRLQAPFEKVKQILETFDDEKIDLVLQWCYSNQINDIKLINLIGDKFGIENIMEKSVQNDLLLLSKDNDSKDFDIIVKDYIEENEEENDQDNDDEDEEGDFEQIPIHKFILAARSGLFREMFKSVKQKTNSVEDYSGKSIEAIEHFVNYLYTDDIQLTADDDPQLIVEELQDAVEYYQLNPQSNLPYTLKKIENQFKK
ncbi:hypothetical protein M0812_01807 [Anaeramoeba flamelloides]|uniref:BTB domain-containing protein n=1 Tax=Anaeramoeba flamelloides TaxID=1746091 RepID=A0AAV7YY04_9EUKA|nr:hypothetical protein M0812_01807 [Anaeramoeba flamelloides]